MVAVVRTWGLSFCALSGGFKTASPKPSSVSSAHSTLNSQMEAAVLRSSVSPIPISSALPPSTPILCTNLTALLCPTCLKKTKLPTAPGLEWQARQREKTKELHRKRREEEEEEERKVEEYREIGLRMKDYPQEELLKATKLVSSFIRSAEEVEEKIEEAAEKGELNELVLMVIWNRLDLAHRDDEKDAVRSLDLLYRRVETEILKREATPAMRLLNDLLNMHDGFDDQDWLKACKKCMVDTFPREDPFSILAPAGFDIDKHEGPLAPVMPVEVDNVLLRVDFVREVAAFLQEVRSQQTEAHNSQGLDPESVASRLKQQEKQRAMHQVEALLDLAINLNW